MEKKNGNYYYIIGVMLGLYWSNVRVVCFTGHFSQKLFLDQSRRLHAFAAEVLEATAAQRERFAPIIL